MHEPTKASDGDDDHPVRAFPKSRVIEEEESSEDEVLHDAETEPSSSHSNVVIEGSTGQSSKVLAKSTNLTVDLVSDSL